jgi:hypothetical protein
MKASLLICKQPKEQASTHCEQNVHLDTYILIFSSSCLNSIAPDGQTFKHILHPLHFSASYMIVPRYCGGKETGGWISTLPEPALSKNPVIVFGKYFAGNRFVAGLENRPLKSSFRIMIITSRVKRET